MDPTTRADGSGGWIIERYASSFWVLADIRPCPRLTVSDFDNLGPLLAIV